MPSIGRVESRFEIECLWKVESELSNPFPFFFIFSGVLVAFMNTTVDEVIDSGLAVQDAWNSGSLSRFELVDKIFDDIFPSNSTVSVEDFLPRLQILVTTFGEGVRITQATNRDELKDLIVKTTWV
jgi:hypothetical protein